MAYIEAIEFLKIQQSLKPFRWSDQLALAAQDHVNDIGPKGMVSTIGSDNSMPTDRINRYAQIDETWGESIYLEVSTQKK